MYSLGGGLKIRKIPVNLPFGGNAEGSPIDKHGIAGIRAFRTA